MKKLIQSFAFLLLFIILLGISGLGSIAPTQMSATAGSYQIAPFENGLSIYQNSRGKYYTLSPFNDYELYKDKSRSSFISIEEVENKTFSHNAQKNHIQNITQSFKEYFKNDSDEITFKSNDKTILYTATIRDNHIRIDRSVSFDDNSSPKILGMTISFQGNDFVFDTKGNLFTYLPQDQINIFNSTFGMSLNANLDFLQIALLDKRVFILNPDLAGTIAIKGKPNQIVRINRDAKMIEIEEVVAPKNEKYSTSFDIYLYESPNEALSSL